MSNVLTTEPNRPRRRARDDASKRARLLVLTFAALCVTGAMMAGPSDRNVATDGAATAGEPDTIALQPLVATGCDTDQPQQWQQWMAAYAGASPGNGDYARPVCDCPDPALSASFGDLMPEATGGTLIVVRD